MKNIKVWRKRYLLGLIFLIFGSILPLIALISFLSGNLHEIGPGGGIIFFFPFIGLFTGYFLGSIIDLFNFFTKNNTDKIN